MKKPNHIGIRLPNLLYLRLDLAVIEERQKKGGRVSRADIIRRALEKYLPQLTAANLEAMAEA